LITVLSSGLGALGALGVLGGSIEVEEKNNHESTKVRKHEKKDKEIKASTMVSTWWVAQSGAGLFAHNLGSLSFSCFRTFVLLFL
jgi:hypothetical protein